MVAGWRHSMGLNNLERIMKYLNVPNDGGSNE